VEIQASPWRFGLHENNPGDPAHCRGVGLRPALATSYHERNLPHLYPPETVLFLTWRLFGSLQGFHLQGPSTTDPGRAFAQADGLLERATEGPLWLKDRRVAVLVAGALDQGEHEYGLYERFAWVIVPNHVHVVMRPFRPLPEVIEMDQKVDCALGQPVAGTYRETILAI